FSLIFFPTSSSFMYQQDFVRSLVYSSRTPTFYHRRRSISLLSTYTPLPVIGDFALVKAFYCSVRWPFVQPLLFFTDAFQLPALIMLAPSNTSCAGLPLMEKASPRSLSCTNGVKTDITTKHSSRNPSLDACFAISPLAKEFKPTPPDFLDEDPAIIQYAPKGRADPIIGPSEEDKAYFTKLLHQGGNHSSTSAGDPKPNLLPPYDLDSAIVRQPLRKTMNDMYKPSAADHAFFVGLLNMPLQESWFEASESQVHAAFDYTANNGACYHKTMVNTGVPEEVDEQATFQASVPPQEEFAGTEGVLLDTAISTPSSQTDTDATSPAITPTTAASDTSTINTTPPPADYLDCAGTLASPSDDWTRSNLAWLNLMISREFDNPAFELEDVDWSTPQYRTPRAPKIPDVLGNVCSVEGSEKNDAKPHDDIEESKINCSVDASLSFDHAENSTAAQEDKGASSTPQLVNTNSVAECGRANGMLDAGDEPIYPAAVGEPCLIAWTESLVMSDRDRDHDVECDDSLQTNDFNRRTIDPMGRQPFSAPETEVGGETSLIRFLRQRSPSENTAVNDGSTASEALAPGVSYEDLVEEGEPQHPSADYTPAHGEPRPGVTDQNEMVRFTASSNPLQDTLDKVFGAFSGNWTDMDEVQEAPVVDATHTVGLPLCTAATGSPPRMCLPDIPTRWLDMFRAEEFKVWRDGTPTGAFAPGTDDLQVAMLAQVALEDAFDNVPKDLYHIADITRTFDNDLWNEGHSKYGPFAPGAYTNGEVEDTAYVGALANMNVQWQLLSEILRAIPMLTRSVLQGVEPEKLDIEEHVFDPPEDRTLHHINFNGDHVYERSYTHPAVSLWAISTTMWKQPFFDTKKRPIVHAKTVLMSQAFKYVDPVQYLGGDNPFPKELVGGKPCYLHGSRLRNAVTCDVEAIYQPYGAWVEDLYDAEDMAPLMWQKGDRYHDGQAPEYVHLQRPYYVNPGHDEHNLCNINDSKGRKPRLHPRSLEWSHGHSPLRKEWSNADGELEVAYTKYSLGWHGVLIGKELSTTRSVKAHDMALEVAAISETEPEVVDSTPGRSNSAKEYTSTGIYNLSNVTADPSTWPPPSQWPVHWPKPNMGFSKTAGWSPYERAIEAKESLLKKCAAAIGKPYLEVKTAEECRIDELGNSEACYTPPSASPSRNGRRLLADKMFHSSCEEEDIASPTQDLGSWEENEDGTFVSPTKAHSKAYSRSPANMLHEFESPNTPESMVDNGPVFDPKTSIRSPLDATCEGNEKAEYGGDLMAELREAVKKMMLCARVEESSPVQEPRDLFQVTLMKEGFDSGSISPLTLPGPLIVEPAQEDGNGNCSDKTTVDDANDSYVTESERVHEVSVYAGVRDLISSGDEHYAHTTDNDTSTDPPSVSALPRCLLHAEDPFEDEGCLFTAQTKSELAFLQAARLIGVEIPWGESSVANGAVSACLGEEGHLERPEQGSVEEIADQVQSRPQGEQAITEEAKVGCEALVKENAGCSDTMAGLTWAILATATAAQETLQQVDCPDVDDKNIDVGIGLSRPRSHHQSPHVDSSTSGYGRRHILAAVALALGICLLWSRTP
ncbi:MAG: hypothetical protein Q9163_005861, partial [Psora crenata]